MNPPDPVVFPAIPRIGDPHVRWPANLYSLKLTAPEGIDPRGRRDIVLTSAEKNYAAVMACFVNQALLQHQEAAFMGHFYGRYFAKWPLPITPALHEIHARRKERLRLVLLWCHQACHQLEPPCDWEVMFALGDQDFDTVGQGLLQMGRDLRDRLRERMGDLPRLRRQIEEFARGASQESQRSDVSMSDDEETPEDEGMLPPDATQPAEGSTAARAIVVSSDDEVPIIRAPTRALVRQGAFSYPRRVRPDESSDD